MRHSLVEISIGCSNLLNRNNISLLGVTCMDLDNIYATSKEAKAVYKKYKMLEKSKVKIVLEIQTQRLQYSQSTINNHSKLGRTNMVNY